MKWFCAALYLMAGFSLSACSDDDDEGSGDGIAAQQPPKVTDVGIQFPVTQYSESSYDMETYTYADGRITGGYDNDGTRFSVSYTPLVLTETDDDGSSSGSFRNIKVNSSGFMTYAEFSANGSDSYDGNWYENGSITWTYDAEGHLIGERGNITESSDGPYSWTSTYTWENGNLMMAEYRDDEYGEVYRYVCTFSYGNNQWNNSGVFPTHMIEVSGFEMPILFYAGLMGRPTQNIPVSITTRNYTGDTETYSETYTTAAVNYNPDTSISSIVISSSYGYSPTYRFGYAAYPINMSSYSAATAMQKGKAVRAMKKARRTMK